MMQLDWLIPGYLAGSVGPVSPVEAGACLDWLDGQGIRLMVNLTEAAPEAQNPPAALEILHFPLEDRGVPTSRATANLCRKMIDAIVAGRPVAVCGSTGFSRTATILACCLVVWRGHPTNAVEQVQRMGSRYVPTEPQREFLQRFDMDLQTHWSSPWARSADADVASREVAGPRIRRLGRHSRRRFA